MMKTNSQVRMWCSAVGSALVLATAACGQQGPPETGFYVRADLGPAFTESVKVQEFLGFRNVGSLDFDTGVRFDVAGGYNFNRFVAAEFESGFIYNSISHSGLFGHGDSSFWQWPLMVNGVVKAPLAQGFTPFIGGGLGGVVSTLDADFLGNPVIGFVDGTDSDLVFGWQGFAGLKYNINDHVGVNVAYRYLGTLTPSWEAEAEHFFFTEERQTVKLDHMNTHAVVLSADFHF